jgi:hypothetical protein
MSNKTFVTAINCMDGRVQQPVMVWLKKELNVDYVDVITEPGPNKILAENTSISDINSIRKRVDISVNKHLSKHIAIVGHHDCAGNPANKATQIQHIKDAVKTIQSWGYTVTVIGLWVDDQWTVHKIV